MLADEGQGRVAVKVVPVATVGGELQAVLRGAVRFVGRPVRVTVRQRCAVRRPMPRTGFHQVGSTQPRLLAGVAADDALDEQAGELYHRFRDKRAPQKKSLARVRVRVRVITRVRINIFVCLLVRTSY